MSSSSSEVVGILETNKELNHVKKRIEEVLIKINKLHKMLQSTPEVLDRPGDNSLSRLKILYTQAKELTDNELTISSQLLEQLDTFVPPELPVQKQRKKAKLETFIWAEGTDHKKKRTKPAADTSKLSPSMRNHLDALASMKGEYVAAKVTQENDKKDQWIVVKVLHFDRETRQFEVLDEEPSEDEEGGGPRKYKLAMSHIIPFPKLNDATGAQNFLLGKQVLAVYPGTTALYKATVVEPRERKTDDYLLEFDDEDEEDESLLEKVVPFHRVVGLPEGHRQ